MSMFWNEKLILAKIETTVGTDANPTGANAVLAKNVTFSPMEGKDEDRALELPYFGSTGTIALDLHAKISFEVELAGSGTAGTAPAWGPLLRACAVAEVITAGTDVTYNPVTRGQEAVTIHFVIGNTRFAMVGTRGNAKLMEAASVLPKISFEFTGLFTQPAEITRPTASYDAWKPPVAVTSQNTPTVQINGVDMVMKSFELDIGNTVEPRFLVGSDGVLITGKADMVAIEVEAVPLTTFNPFALAAGGTQVPVEIVHGTQAGNIIAFNAPKAQLQRPASLANSQDVTEWPLSLILRPDAGNDQWTLTLT